MEPQSGPPSPQEPIAAAPKRKRWLYGAIVLAVVLIAAGARSVIPVKKQPVQPTVRVSQKNPKDETARFDDSLQKYQDSITPVAVSPTPFPAIVPAHSYVYPYYFADDKGVWRKNSLDESPVLVYESSQTTDNQYRGYVFKVIRPNLIAAAYYSGSVSESDLYECRYDTAAKKADCTRVDAVNIFGRFFPIELVPGESSYVYLRKTPKTQSWIGVVYAQIPYSLDVMKRDFSSGSSVAVSQIEQQMGCGGGSWHGLYYHGYRTGMLITSNKMMLLQLGCEGYPGDGSQYVIDINQKKVIPGRWDFISPVEIGGGRILFHRIPQLWNHENKPWTHVFFTVPVSDLTDETKLFDLGPGKYVSGLTYDGKTKQAYISYIDSPDQLGTGSYHDVYDLRIAQFDPEVASPSAKDIYTTKGYYLDRLIPGIRLLFHYSDLHTYTVKGDPWHPLYNKENYLGSLDVATLEATEEATIDLSPAAW